jgi:hypothetical protein
MKKLTAKYFVAIVMLATAASYASANDVTLPYYFPPVATATVSEVSSPAPEVTVNSTAPTALEKGANKVGSFLGNMLKGPAILGKALTSGFSAGFSGQAVKPATVAAHETPAPAVQAAPPADTSKLVSALQPLSNQLAALLRRSKDQPAAPVEDHSFLAANPN